MSESEDIKVPICLVYSRRVDSFAHQYITTSFTFGKIKYEIRVDWNPWNEKQGTLARIVFSRACRAESCIMFQEGDILEGQVTIQDSELLPGLTQSNQRPNQTNAPINSSTTPQLSADFLQILNNKDTFADAKLKCGATEIDVHKCILSARSPVFDAMFKNKMKESQNGVVVIEDMESNVLQAMLRYVYSGKSDHLTDLLTEDLLYASDKYQLKELKSICVEKLKKATTVDNVVRILVLGHLLDESLKKHATEFVCNFSKITQLENTEGWKSLLVERPGLANEILMAVVKKLQNC